MLGVKLILIILAIDPLAADTFGLPKSALSHAVSVAMAGLLVWGCFRSRLVPKFGAIPILVTAFVLMNAVATLFAVDMTVALFGAPRRYLGLAHIGDGAVTFWAASLVLSNSANRARVLAAIIGACAIVVLYGYVQSVGSDPLHFAEGSTRLPISTMGQPDILSGFLSIVAITATGAALTGRQNLARFPLGGLSVLAGAAFFLLLLTHERAGLLGVGAGFGALLIILILDPRKTRFDIGLAASLGAVAVIAVAFSPTAQRLTDLTADPNVLARLEMWQTAARIAITRPVWGAGPDNFAVLYPAMRSESSVFINGVGVLQTSTHNWMLYLLTSSGVLGLASMVSLIAVVCWALIKAARSGAWISLGLIPLAAYLGQGIADVTDLTTDWVFWFVVGLTAGAPDWQPRRAFASSAWSRRDIIPGVLVVILLGVALQAAANRIAGSRYVAEANALITVHRPLAAVSSARAALALEDRRGLTWSTFGVALNSAGNASAASSAFEAGSTREPWSPLHWRNLGIARIAAGEGSRAIVAFQAAIRADPYDAQSLELLASALFDRQMYAQAAEVGTRAARLLPDRVDAYEAPVRAEVALGHLADAEALLRVAMSHVDSNYIRVRLAEILLRENKRAEATQLVEYVLARESGNADAIELRQQLRQ